MMALIEVVGDACRGIDPVDFGGQADLRVFAAKFGGLYLIGPSYSVVLEKCSVHLVAPVETVRKEQAIEWSVQAANNPAVPAGSLCAGTCLPAFLP
jgi:hypothetical protein